MNIKEYDSTTNSSMAYTGEQIFVKAISTTASNQMLDDNDDGKQQDDESEEPQMKRQKTARNSCIHNTCVSYIMRTPDILGKFDIDKATELGVPRGPLYGQLKGGKDITLEDGTLILSSDIVQAPNPGRYLAIVDCSNLELLNDIVTNISFNEYFDNGDDSCSKHLDSIIHYTPLHIFQGPIYQTWISKFVSRNHCNGNYLHAIIRIKK